MCGFLIGWRKGALQSLRWSDVSDDVVFLRAKNSHWKARRRHVDLSTVPGAPGA
jgi:hypothetical protein